MSEKINIDVCSEFGKLDGVIIHTPGREVEEMTPGNAKRALYGDILNLSTAKKEYAQMKGVLNMVSKTFEVEDLLAHILKTDEVKISLLKDICESEDALNIYSDLLDIAPKELARQLIQGVPLRRDNLTRYLSEERFSLWPLHNFFFTRDASMSFRNEVIIGKMANKVRDRETLIMEAIFNFHPSLNATTVNCQKNTLIPSVKKVFLEGGDFLAVREDLVVIGNGSRTSTQAIDLLVEKMKRQKERKFNILVQQLPEKPESFIHLDMVFTFLDVDACVVYKPVIFDNHHNQTINICIENGKVTTISDENNLPDALRKLHVDVKPIFCGGSNDSWIQEREQWHSGANFFAFAPGKVMGYERNVHTIGELNKNGFEVVRAEDLLKGRASMPTGKCVVTIAGSELSRGGGGARCMTMPFSRQKVDW